MSYTSDVNCMYIINNEQICVNKTFMLRTYGKRDTNNWKVRRCNFVNLGVPNIDRVVFFCRINPGDRKPVKAERLKTIEQYRLRNSSYNRIRFGARIFNINANIWCHSTALSTIISFFCSGVFFWNAVRNQQYFWVK